MNLVIRAVVLANRIVLWTLLLIIGLMMFFAAVELLMNALVGYFYAPFALGMPFVWLAGCISGPAAALLHLSSRWDGFWHSAAPPVLGMVSLNFALASGAPPPAVVGAPVSAVLGALCLLARPHHDTPGRRWGTLPLFALPFLNMVPPLAFWAPLTAAVLFIGIRLWVPVSTRRLG